MNRQTELELVEKSLYGDQEAFALLVRKYSNVVYSVAFSVLNDFHLSEDIAQEVFIKAWYNMEKLRDLEKFGGWIVSITRNLCKDTLRKRKITEGSLNEANYIVDYLTLDEQISRKLDEQALQKALEVLDEKYRTTILMYYFGGFNTNEISRLLDVPIRTTESRLRRSRMILKERLIKLVENTANEQKLDDAFVGKVKSRITMKYASHVMVVKNFSDAQQYYKDVMGFTIDGEFVFREGVHFLFKESNVEGAVRPNSSVGVVLDTYIWVEDVDVLYEELKAKGANIIFGPVDMEYNMRDLLVEDLYGYRLCFGSPVKKEH